MKSIIIVLLAIVLFSSTNITPAQAAGQLSNFNQAALEQILAEAAFRMGFNGGQMDVSKETIERVQKHTSNMIDHGYRAAQKGLNPEAIIKEIIYNN